MECTSCLILVYARSVCLFVCPLLKSALLHTAFERSMAAEESQRFLFAFLPESRRWWLNKFSHGACDAIFLLLFCPYRHPHPACCHLNAPWLLSGVRGMF